VVDVLEDGEMVNSVTKTPGLIVTLETLLTAERARSTGFESSSVPTDKDALALYDRAVTKLSEETSKTGSEVFVVVEDRYVSMLQSRIAELGALKRPLQGGGFEAMFGEGLTGGDVWGWIRSVFDHVSKDDWHPIVRPSNTKADTIADNGRMAIVGDWGTNLYGAPVSAASISRTGGYEMVLHLGDVYYSGTTMEIENRFLEAWPNNAGKISRALNGNHEMYSGGYAYFDHVLPRFKQASSYFALQNTNWLFLGLDTAHTEHNLDSQQVAWLKTIVQQANGRKVVLFSHHQPFSRLDKQGPKLLSALADLLHNKAITAWYWGHEHNCIIYDAHPNFGLLGRCVGHGGIPSPRKSKVVNAPVVETLNNIAWKRLGARRRAPSCLVLDGANPLVPGEENKFGPHGYLTLEFVGPQLIEQVHLPDGGVIWRRQIA
jgi:hypothetical protein